MPTTNVHPLVEWITISEAAGRLHRSTKTIRRWIKQGVIPAHQLVPGGSYLIDAHKLDAIVRSKWSARTADDAA
jgi:excisionase family DNA binding protein